MTGNALAGRLKLPCRMTVDRADSAAQSSTISSTAFLQLTWFAHVYLDTVLLVCSIGAQQPAAARSWIIAGTFQGPQAYITPGWCPGKAEHGKVVPTWNYVVAHAHGVARAIDDRDWMLDMLNRLTDDNEARQLVPWSVGDAPRSFIGKLMRAIVGIEIPIDRLEGKLKASQDEAMPDRLGTVRGLQQETCDEARTMVDFVMKAIQADAAG